MGQKHSKIQSLVEPFLGQALDARYLGYFDCFNRGLFFEAHEVLEDLWLLDRKGAEGNFYKGLIQLAGAFVHLQKGRPSPATSLFRLTLGNLKRYPAIHRQLDLSALTRRIENWILELEQGKSLLIDQRPHLKLETKK